MKRRLLLSTVVFYVLATELGNLSAQDVTTEKPTPQPVVQQETTAIRKPTLGDLAYGEHPRQVLDFYRAQSGSPAPLLFFIHGGGWMAGDKSKVANLDKFLDAGVSVVSINYRYVSQAYDLGIKPPVQAPLQDAARALQFVRSKAEEWNIDPKRIGASGGSAGACSCLWLAFHDDLANPKSGDPIARQSTRLTCAAVTGAQTTLDPIQMKEWTPNSCYGSHAFGIFQDSEKKYVQDFAAFLQKRDELSAWITEYSPYALVTADDPPVYLLYRSPPALGEAQKDPTHSSNFGVKLQERMSSVGVPCELVYPGAENVQHATALTYLLDRLN